MRCIFLFAFSSYFIYNFCYSQQNIPSSVIREFDLDKSIFYAERNRKEVILARREIELAKERVSEAKSDIYPKIDFLFNYTEEPVNQLIMLPPSFGGIRTMTYTGHYYFTRFSFWENIYSGGRYKTNVAVAESNLASNENQLKVVLNNINYQVKESFYQLLAEEEKLKIYQIVLSTMQKLYSDSKLTQKSNFDYLQSREIIEQTETEYLLTRNNYKQLQLKFLNTVGIELNTIFKIDGKLEPKIEEFNINELLALSFQYRPEPKQILVQEKIDDLALKLSLTARDPTITLGANYEFYGEEAPSMLNSKLWNITLNLNLPIFHGWSSWSRIKQKRIQLEQGKLQRKDIEDNIRLETRTAYNNYNFWVEEVNRRNKMVSEYENILKTIPQQDILALVKTYKLYLQSNLNYIDAACNNLISYAAIEHAIGKPLNSK